MAILRADGFINAITSVGSRRDVGKRFSFSIDGRLPKSVLDSIYAENPLAWKIVDLLPDDATRRGIEIDHTDADRIRDEMERLDCMRHIRIALKKSRLYGGSAILLDIADGQPLNAPASAPAKIRSMTVIDPDAIWPDQYSPYKKTEFYSLSTDDAYTLVHISRLLVFDGLDVSYDARISNNGWGESVIRRCYHPLIAVDVAHGLVPTILQDYIQGVLKLQGLNDLMANDCDGSTDTLKARLEAMLYGRSIINDLVLDKEDEYVRQTTSVTGINDLIRNPERWLVAASGIPHTKLLGESPGSALSQSGASQERDWHKAIRAYQEDEIRLPLRQLLHLIAGEYVAFEFAPLDEPTEIERAELHAKQAQADAVYFQMGVLSADDIAISRFGRGKYTTHTTIDWEARERAQQVQIED